jgi:chromosome segregation ATPase
MDAHEAERQAVESRLDAHDGALAGLPELASRLNEHEAALAGLPELESHLTSRLEEHDTARQATESRLDAHQSALAALPELVSHLERHESAMADLRHVKERVTSQIEKQNDLIHSMDAVSTEQRSVLESVAESVGAAQERMQALETKMATASESAQQAHEAAQRVGQSVEMYAGLFDELHALAAATKSHGAAIDSIRASMARTDDFMERVVEALESLQTMVLEQARDRAVA